MAVTVRGHELSATKVQPGDECQLTCSKCGIVIGLSMKPGETPTVEFSDDGQGNTVLAVPKELGLYMDDCVPDGLERVFDETVIEMIPGLSGLEV